MPCQDTNGMRTGHISGISVVQALGNAAYWPTGSGTATGLVAALGTNTWEITGLDAGQNTTVRVLIARGTGTQAPYYYGTYDWRSELLGSGVNEYEVEFVVYPTVST
ncbi:MAG: hypothetical protein CUN57_02325, partial [Phototrophicales bacterium]